MSSLCYTNTYFSVTPTCGTMTSTWCKGGPYGISQYTHLEINSNSVTTLHNWPPHIHVFIVSLEWCNIMDNQYKYTSDLMSLDHNNAGPSYLPNPPQRAGPIPPIPAWSPFLESHPDKSFSHYITKGLTTGFRVGFDPTLVTLRQSNRNHCVGTGQSTDSIRLSAAGMPAG